MPIDISDEDLSEVGQTIQNIDFETLDRIQRMEFGKARTATIVDPTTQRDISGQVKRQLSTLAGKIGRKLKYYNRKDFPQQIPEGKVGFEVVSETPPTPEIKQMLMQLENWRAEQAKLKEAANATNGTNLETNNSTNNSTPEVTTQETVQEAPVTAQNGSRRPSR